MLRRPAVRDYILSDHVVMEMRRRGLPEEIVRAVLESPDQEMEVRPGRMAMQSRVEMGQPPRTYLLRVFVDVDRQPPEVVTVYRTSRIAKYWRTPS